MLIILQLLKAFPDVAVQIPKDRTDAWHICTICGPMQPGMGVWLADHNLTTFYTSSSPGVQLRWTSNPEGERAMISSVLRHAQASIEDVQSGMEDGTYDPKDNAEIYYERGLAQRFEKLCKELDLL